MENIDLLQRHGLFDAKVPRYTSYPPANHFQNDLGQDRQRAWLDAVPADDPVSVYIHIPFCRRLCWFCACRTQGTKTLKPVDAYLEVLHREIEAVFARLPAGLQMSRLHLGGGTPTLLPALSMARLLQLVFSRFTLTQDFEFSVEIDPTEAEPDLLNTLMNFKMNRASIGVQDFAPQVQAAIGRLQSLKQTRAVIDHLRDRGVEGINLDLLYGLPHQTPETFQTTLDHITGLDPDRLAIYGYAHVPWMSKRQVMIQAATLPDTRQRFDLARLAADVLTGAGYEPVGIDHFAKPTDGLFRASAAGTLRRNFQGYTDDQSATLIGFGASAISRFAGGFVQNAVATSAYQDRVLATGVAGHRGYALTDADRLIATMIETLMCRFTFPTEALQQAFPEEANWIAHIAAGLLARYPDVFAPMASGMRMRTEAQPLARIVAKEIDAFSSAETAHAAAI